MQKKKGREENVDKQRVRKKRRKTQKIKNQEKIATTAGQCSPAHGRQASVRKREIRNFWTEKTNETTEQRNE